MPHEGSALGSVIHRNPGVSAKCASGETRCDLARTGRCGAGASMVPGETQGSNVMAGMDGTCVCFTSAEITGSGRVAGTITWTMTVAWK